MTIISISSSLQQSCANLPASRPKPLDGAPYHHPTTFQPKPPSAENSNECNNYCVEHEITSSDFVNQEVGVQLKAQCFPSSGNVDILCRCQSGITGSNEC